MPKCKVGEDHDCEDNPSADRAQLNFSRTPRTSHDRPPSNTIKENYPGRQREHHYETTIKKRERPQVALQSAQLDSMTRGREQTADDDTDQPIGDCVTQGSRPGRLPTQRELLTADYGDDENSSGPAEKVLGHGGYCRTPTAQNPQRWPNDDRVALQIKPRGLFRLIDMVLLPPPA